jgi:hypothetical protein
MDGFCTPEEMALYKSDKVEFYRRKNQLAYAEMHANLALLKEKKKMRLAKWIALKLLHGKSDVFSSLSSINDELEVRRAGREHDKLAKELDAALDQMRIAMKLQENKIQTEFNESVTAYFNEEKEMMDAFLFKLRLGLKLQENKIQAEFKESATAFFNEEKEMMDAFSAKYNK